MRSLRLLLRALAPLALALSQAGADAQLVYVAADDVADPALAARLADYGGADATRFVIELTTEERLDGVDWCLAPESKAVDDEAWTRRIGEADVLVLRGGHFMPWYDTVYPPGRRTHLARALQDFVQTSKPILAYGGACAFLSGGVSVPVGELRKPERNPRRSDPFRARVALGVGPRALFDADAWADGSPLRLLRALHATRLDHGFHFVGEVALELQRDPPQLRVLGPGEVLVFDLGRARRRRVGVDHARVSRLVAGDVWGLAFDRVELGDERTPRDEPEVRDARLVGDSLEPAGVALSGWLAEHAQRPAREALREVAPASGPGDAAGRDHGARWILGWDAGASGWTPRDGGSADTWVGIPFRCDWGPR